MIDSYKENLILSAIAILMVLTFIYRPREKLGSMSSQVLDSLTEYASSCAQDTWSDADLSKESNTAVKRTLSHTLWQQESATAGGLPSPEENEDSAFTL